ncbi:MAG: nucleotide exchange factor GrpE [Gammaproteobacteria bacterium]|nr:nucleotide exchange factor GrpE [Gammaproteobacteria bacterium]MCW8923259.1 nucleotide exchange factor GrpE [Gammaproteobacteria bacterium]
MSSNEANQEQEPVIEDVDHEAEMQAEEESLVQAEDDLIEQLNQAKSKAEENWDLLLRTKAEMENLRRRTQKDLENAHKFGIEKFVTELLPIMDSMELGLAVEEASVESLREGMTLTVNMVSQMFEKFNIEVVDPINEKFDPELHQAMSAQPTDEVEPNTILAVMQKGYRLNGRLVRPAMVMVSKAAE